MPEIAFSLPRRFKLPLGIVYLSIILYAPVALATQEEASAQDDVWGRLRLLVGRWEGAIDGALGTGTGVREYELILEDNFLMFRHASVREPQEKSPAGDHHRELGIFSFDSEREQLILRGFFVEGYAIRYACDAAGQRIVCVTEHVESGPGIRARLTLEIHDAYSFDEVYELAFPDAELSVYFTNRWTRIPALR